MALSKIQAESINLADTFAFTGTVSGTDGGFAYLAEQDASSTTQVDFTIPSGAKQIVFTAEEFNTTATGSPVLLIQLGDSGGVENSGYFVSEAYTANLQPSAGNHIFGDNNTSDNAWNLGQWSGHVSDGRRFYASGQIVQTRNSNTWMCNTQVLYGPSAQFWIHLGGRKTLSAELTTVRFSSFGTFSTGHFRLAYHL